MDVSRDKIHNIILEISRTVKKTVETIKTKSTNIRATGAANKFRSLNVFLKCHDDTMTSLDHSKHLERLQINRADYLGGR